MVVFCVLCVVPCIFTLAIVLHMCTYVHIRIRSENAAFYVLRFAAAEVWVSGVWVSGFVFACMAYTRVLRLGQGRKFGK